MRHRRLTAGRAVWAACLAWAAAPLANAQTPAPSPRLLGVTESILNYCGPRDPSAAARLRQKIKQLVQGASTQQLAEVRQSNEYRKAYESVVDFTAKIDEHNVKRFCAENPVAR